MAKHAWIGGLSVIEHVDYLTTASSASMPKHNIQEVTGGQSAPHLYITNMLQKVDRHTQMQQGPGAGQHWLAV
jgi:hypothetical protein